MRFLAITVAILLLMITLAPSLPFTTTKHGCASVTPPAVSGTLVQPAATRGTLFINEALLTPHSTWNCSELGVYTPANDSWIEIYNAQNSPFDLYSVHTSLDSGPNTNPFYFPFGSAIAPYGFLVVFPRRDANFPATETSTLRLLIEGIPIDEVTIPAMGEDQSYARIPDGSSTWVITSIPTIDTSNITSVVPPTPTMTKAEATATARASDSNKGGSSRRGSTGRSSSNSTSTTDNGTTISNGQQIDGIQPAWSSLRRPETASTPSSTSAQPTNALPGTSNTDMDIPHKILLTLLVIAFTATLLWCWRLFRAS